MSNYIHYVGGDILKETDCFEGGYEERHRVCLVDLSPNTFYIGLNEYRYAVGEYTYSRNYTNEWVENPTLFRTKEEAERDFENQAMSNGVTINKEECISNT